MQAGCHTINNGCSLAIKNRKITFNYGQRYDAGIVWAEDGMQLPTDAVPVTADRNCYRSNVKNGLSGYTILRKKYEKHITDNLEKVNVITVPGAHMVEQWSDKEWHKPHHQLIKPNKPGKCLGYKIFQQSSTSFF